MAGGIIKQKVQTEFTAKGSKNVVRETEAIGRAQTRLGQASASAGRQFSAQANGLGGLVAAYAGAAATVFAITAAFEALNRAAQTAQVVEGLNALATTVGTTGSKILQQSQQITKGLVSIRETAETVNIGLSAGFNQEQILALQKVSLGASRALGRTLTDALTRVLRGTAKLEPELLDELGIFVKIDPAVEAYAAKLNKTASALTDFERRQAFANAVIEQGTQKFSIIDTSSGNALESLQRLATVVVDLGAKVGAVLADFIAPFADYISNDFGNTLAVFGLLARTVFGSALGIAIAGLQKGTAAAQGFANALGEKFAGDAEKQGIAFGKLAIATEKLDMRMVGGTRSQQKYRRELLRMAKDGTLAVQDLTRLEKVLTQLRLETTKGSAQFKRYTAALKQVAAAQAATGKGTLFLSNSLGAVSKGIGVFGAGILKAVRGVTTFVTGISVARLVLKPFTDALGVTDEIDDFIASLFQFSLRLFGLDEAAKQAKKGFDGLASSLLSSSDLFKELPEKVTVLQRSLFGLTTLEKEFDQAGLNTLLSELLENLSDPTAIEDFRKKFVGATYEAQQALDEILRLAVEFEDAFGRAGPAIARQLGAINAQTGVSARALGDFLRYQQQISQLPAGAFQGVQIGEGGVINQINAQLEETGVLLKIQVADQNQLLNLIEAGRFQEAERLKIGSGIVGLLTQERAFRKELEEGGLSAEQIKKKEAAIQAILTDLIERATKLGDEALKTDLERLAASQTRLKAESEIQTQQDLFNKRLRKDFSAQIGAADKLNGLVDLNLQLGRSDREVKKNQLDQVTAILATEATTTKEKEIRATTEKIAAGLVQEQLETIKKITEEEKKRLQNLESQIKIQKLQNDLLDSKNTLNAIKEENQLRDQQLKLGEKLRAVRQDIRQQEGKQAIAELQAQLDLNSQILDKRSKLFSARQLQELKIRLEEESLAALKKENDRLIAERRVDLNKEIELLKIKASDDIKALNQQRDVAEKQAALEIEKITQDKAKFDLEQNLIDQELELIKTQAQIFTQFTENLARILSSLTADLKIATDPKIKERVAGGENIADIRAGLVEDGIGKLIPQIQKGLDLTEIDALRTKVKESFSDLQTQQIVGITKTERATEESIERQIKGIKDRAVLEEAIARSIAEKDINALLEAVGVKERDIEAQKELNRQLSVYEVLQEEAASSIRGGLVSAFEELNQAFIEGRLTMRSISDTFRNMIGNMLKEIQSAVFKRTIAEPLAESISSNIVGTAGLFGGVKTEAAGGVVHLAAGGMKRDRVPALLEPGEFVVRKEAVKNIGLAELMELNTGTRKLAAGGKMLNAENAKILGFDKYDTSAYGRPLTPLERRIVARRSQSIQKPANYDEFLPGTGLGSFTTDIVGTVPALGKKGNTTFAEDISSVRKAPTIAQRKEAEAFRAEEARRSGQGPQQGPGTQTRYTPDTLKAFGVGSRGMALPGTTLLAMLGVNVPRIGAKPPPSLGGADALAAAQISKELAAIYGVDPTRMKGFQKGDIDPVTGGLFGRDGSAQTNIGNALFGARDSRGQASFTSLGAVRDAVFGTESDPGFRFRRTRLSLAEYNAASLSARAKFNPETYRVTGGQRFLTKNQSFQLNTYGGYKNVGGGYTIPDGSFSGTIRDVDLGPRGNDIDVGGRIQSSGAKLGGSGFNASRDLGFGGVGFAAGGPVLNRDRVPALLEPGEFVVRRPVAKAIGGQVLGAMNSGAAKPGDVQINMNNQGVPKTAEATAPRFDGERFVVDIITRDLKNNGQIRKSLRARSTG